MWLTCHVSWCYVFTVGSKNNIKLWGGGPGVFILAVWRTRPASPRLPAPTPTAPRWPPPPPSPRPPAPTPTAPADLLHRAQRSPQHPPPRRPVPPHQTPPPRPPAPSPWGTPTTPPIAPSAAPSTHPHGTPLTPAQHPLHSPQHPAPTAPHPPPCPAQPPRLVSRFPHRKNSGGQIKKWNQGSVAQEPREDGPPPRRPRGSHRNQNGPQTYLSVPHIPIRVWHSNPSQLLCFIKFSHVSEFLSL